MRSAFVVVIIGGEPDKAKIFHSNREKQHVRQRNDSITRSSYSTIGNPNSSMKDNRRKRASVPRVPSVIVAILSEGFGVAHLRLPSFTNRWSNAGEEHMKLQNREMESRSPPVGESKRCVAGGVWSTHLRSTQSDIRTNRHDYAAISKRRQRAEEKLSMQREIRGISILLPSGGSQWEQTNTTTTKSLQKPVFKTLYFVEQRDCTRRFGGKGMFPGPPTGIRSIKDSEKQGQKQGHVKSIDRLHGGY